MEFDVEAEISPQAYGWSVRLFSIARKLLGLNIKLHHDEGQIGAGEIFLFNHFARFETFIPQYLIYEETGTYCRSVAAAEFFGEDDAFSNYLLSVGAIPNNYKRLIPYLAAEILRGRKVIIFPEGGMVKDRRVVDRAGEYSIYSRTAQERRKHHTGAAVLSLALDIFKKTVLKAHAKGDTPQLEDWVDELKLGDVDELIAAASRPSTIVPANITFYPMRVGDNLLRKGVDLFNRGMSRRLSEELLIEGNILLKHTDMDIRLGDPIHTDTLWNWLDRQLIRRAARRIRSLDDVLAPPIAGHRVHGGLRERRIRFKALALRDNYMRSMYTQVTVNLSHLASKIIYRLLDDHLQYTACDRFHRILYLAVKYAQREPSVHLHRSLLNPEAYGELIEGRCAGLEQFFSTAASLGLVEREDNQYQFLPKLCDEHEFDDIRTENLVEVYANEVAPLGVITHIVERAIADAPQLGDKPLGDLRFDDEMRSYHWDKTAHSKPRHRELNAKETATQSGEPFLFLPENHKPLGIVLSHGFLASPAEVRAFGERLAGLGYPVIGVRLKGHGTSPWDLRKRSWRDWKASIERAYRIMETHVERICLVGFSTGGALSLLLAADQPDCLEAVVALSVPIKFRNRNMLVVVPMVHGANKLVKWVSSYEGVVPFRPNTSEHPNINYYSMPVKALFELRQMAGELQSQLKKIHCPVKLFQGEEDHVVNPRSAVIIHEKLSSAEKDLVTLPTDRHGILNENIDNVQERIIGFLDGLTDSESPPQQAPPAA